MIRLTAGHARLQILPQMGGGLAGLWAGALPVLRPWSGRVEDGPFALACNLLVPFSNRISAGFTFNGQYHSIAPNLPGEAYPIHGDGFQRIWELGEIGPTRVELTLPNGEIGPFIYASKVSYILKPEVLESELSVTNLGSFVLPFGLGLHPWFPRDSETRLQFTASGHRPESADHLPATLNALNLDHGGPWRLPAPLPEDWINEGFTGWNGHARITQGAKAASVDLIAKGLGTALLYSPSAQADFFCFEPVSHPVDAHNLPEQPGLTALAPGQTLTTSMTLIWGPAK
jgi:aldose 1-epimerase